ncbi:hypothetical protein SHIRM173S_05041 [Streptomyces hirsutus]
MREHVVQFAGDPEPFLVRAPPYRPGALGALPCPLLAADPGQFRHRHDGHHPGGDHDLLAPGGSRVAGRRQPPVEHMGEQQVTCPECSHRRPCRPAMTGDDGAEAGYDDGQEHRPVRVAGAQIEQHDGHGGEHHRHRMPLPPQQHRSGREQQQAREGIEGDALALLGVLREGGADQHEGGEQQGGGPGPP